MTKLSMAAWLEAYSGAPYSHEEIADLLREKLRKTGETASLIAAAELYLRARQALESGLDSAGFEFG